MLAVGRNDLFGQAQEIDGADLQPALFLGLAPRGVDGALHQVDLAADDVPEPGLGRLQPFAQQHPPVGALDHQAAADAGEINARLHGHALGASTDG